MFTGCSAGTHHQFITLQLMQLSLAVAVKARHTEVHHLCGGHSQLLRPCTAATAGCPLAATCPIDPNALQLNLLSRDGRFFLQSDRQLLKRRLWRAFLQQDKQATVRRTLRYRPPRRTVLLPSLPTGIIRAGSLVAQCIYASTRVGEPGIRVIREGLVGRYIQTLDMTGVVSGSPG